MVENGPKIICRVALRSTGFSFMGMPFHAMPADMATTKVAAPNVTERYFADRSTFEVTVGLTGARGRFSSICVSGAYCRVVCFACLLRRVTCPFARQPPMIPTGGGVESWAERWQSVGRAWTGCARRGAKAGFLFSASTS